MIFRNYLGVRQLIAHVMSLIYLGETGLDRVSRLDGLDKLGILILKP